MLRYNKIFIAWGRVLLFLLTFLLLISFSTCKSTDRSHTNTEEKILEGQNYFTKDKVAEYIHKFNELPPNYIIKKEARELGWNSFKGNLWEVTDKKSIGGDYFGNYEGLLPKTDNRIYYECDVNYYGSYRGGERIVFSNDGLIFYSDNHYKSFERLY